MAAPRLALVADADYTCGKSAAKRRKGAQLSRLFGLVGGAVAASAVAAAAAPPGPADYQSESRDAGIQQVLDPTAEAGIIRQFSNDIPADLRQRLLAEVDAGGPCSKARDAYARALLDNGAASPDDFRRNGPLLTALANACLAPLLQPAERDRTDAETARSRIGVFVQAADRGWGTDIFCTGYALTPRRIATARHCVLHGATMRPAALQSIYFVAALAPHDPIAVSAVEDLSGAPLPDAAFVDAEQQDDAVIVTLASDAAVAAEPLSIAPRLAAGLRLFAPGFFPSLAYFSGRTDALTPLRRAGEELTRDELSLRLADAAHGDWTRFLYFDPREMCRSWEVTRDVCLLHTCTTVAGFSGSPLLARGSGEAAPSLAFLGAHVGVLRARGSGCRPATTERGLALLRFTPNLGVLHASSPPMPGKFKPPPKSGGGIDR